MTPSLDLVLLNQIIEHEYSIPPGITPMEALPVLLENLGCVDSNLREASLDVLWSWLVEDQYSDDTMISVARQMTKNLSKGLGEECSDSVFLRAFSTLILGALISIDQQRSAEGKELLFSKTEILEWMRVSIHLLLSEKDLRGYVENKGWAHCLAHTGDLLGRFACHPALGRGELESMLVALQERFVKPVDHVLVHNEDERLAAVVIYILQRDLVPIDFFITWLDGFVNFAGGLSWKEAFTHPTANCARVNTKNFLRGVYFFLVFGFEDQPAYKYTETGEKLVPLLLHTLKQIYPNSRYGNQVT